MSGRGDVSSFFNTQMVLDLKGKRLRAIVAEPSSLGRQPIWMRPKAARNNQII